MKSLTLLLGSPVALTVILLSQPFHLKSLQPQETPNSRNLKKSTVKNSKPQAHTIAPPNDSQTVVQNHKLYNQLLFTTPK